MVHQPIDHGGGQRVIDVEDLPQSRKARFVVNTIDPDS